MLEGTDPARLRANPRRVPRFPRPALWMVLSLMVLAVSCGSSDDGPGDDSSGALEAHTVAAASGAVELTLLIPEAALPEGLGASEITISPLAVEPVESEDSELLGAFELGPDGAVFAGTVLAGVTVRAGEGAVQLALRSGDGETEVLEAVGALDGVEAGSRTLVFAVPHFSDLHVILSKQGESSRVVIVDRPRESYLVGESFDVRVRVHSGYSNWSTYDQTGDEVRREQYSTLRDRPWTGEVGWDAGAPDASGAVDELADMLTSSLFSDGVEIRRNETPIEPVKATSSIGEADTYTAAFATQRFTCVRAGDFVIDIWAKVQNTAQVEVSETGLGSATFPHDQEMGVAYASGADGVYDRIVGRCVATATPEPTATSGIEGPTEEATGTSTAGPTATASPEAERGNPNDSVPPGKVLVFLLDGVYFNVSGLEVVAAHLPFCSYEHVHGPTIKSIVPQANGSYAEASEHPGECGFGPPNFYVIEDPR